MTRNQINAATAMRNAWSIARAAAAETGDKPSVFFREALKQAWAEIKTPQIYTTMKGNQVTVDFDRKQVTALADGKVFDYQRRLLRHYIQGNDYVAFVLNEDKRQRNLIVLDLPSSEKLRETINGQTVKKEAFEGVEALRNAYLEEEMDYERTRKAIESGNPVLPGSSKNLRETIAQLEARYPRAKVYLRAAGYINAAHYAKAAAGRKAQNLLATGGSITDAEAVLDNWMDGVFVD